MEINSDCDVSKMFSNTECLEYMKDVLIFFLFQPCNLRQKLND